MHNEAELAQLWNHFGKLPNTTPQPNAAANPSYRRTTSSAPAASPTFRDRLVRTDGLRRNGPYQFSISVCFHEFRINPPCDQLVGVPERVHFKVETIKLLYPIVFNRLIHVSSVELFLW